MSGSENFWFASFRVTVGDESNCTCMYNDFYSDGGELISSLLGQLFLSSFFSGLIIDLGEDFAFLLFVRGIYASIQAANYDRFVHGRFLLTPHASSSSFGITARIVSPCFSGVFMWLHGVPWGNMGILRSLTGSGPRVFIIECAENAGGNMGELDGSCRQCLYGGGNTPWETPCWSVAVGLVR